MRAAGAHGGVLFTAAVQAEVQRRGEDKDHRQHLHGRDRS